MLLWSSPGRAVAALIAVLLFGLFYALPIGVIALASISGQWNGVLPEQLTFDHYLSALYGDAATQLRVSVVTGAVASGAALVCGTWAALATRRVDGRRRHFYEMMFFLPSAVPSVSIGLGLLVAFSQPPLLLNGNASIVFIAHFVIVFALCYGNVAAGLSSLPPEFEQIAQSLGARPFYRLSRVTLPLLAPHLRATFSLCFALSMGELGATLMIYPPGWITLPVGIFTLSDRGALFDAAALAMMLGGTTLLVLSFLSRVGRQAPEDGTRRAADGTCATPATSASASSHPPAPTKRKT